VIPDSMAGFSPCSERRFWPVLLIAALFLAGCSATYHVALDRPTARNDTLSLSRLNSRLADTRVIVHRVSGPDLQGSFESCNADSSRFLGDSSGVQAIVPTSDIKTIEFADHWSGLLGGLLAGFAGFFVCVSLGVLIGYHDPKNPITFVFLLGALFSLFGLPIIGGIDGIPNTIIFPRDPTTSPVLQRPDTLRLEEHTDVRTMEHSLSGDSLRSAGQPPR
jgi:hypothetical protein